MFDYLKRKLRSVFYSMGATPAGYWRPVDLVPRHGAIVNPADATTISPFFAALRLFQSTIGSLPLLTYRQLPEGGREEAEDRPEYPILCHRPNRAMSAPILWESCIFDLFINGEFFLLISQTGNGLDALYPIPAQWVTRIVPDQDWHKTYTVMNPWTGQQEYGDDEIIHVIHYSTNGGWRGTPFLSYAGEALGLHRHVMEAAAAYYRNAPRPAMQIKYPLGSKLDPQTKATIGRTAKDELAGAHKAGAVLVTDGGGEASFLSPNSAAESQLIEALDLSVADVCRWFGIDPLVLGDKEAATFANLAAAHTSFYSKSIRPILNKVESELNWKVFPTNRLFAEFDTAELLRGDPVQQASIDQSYLTAGVLLRSEVRQRLGYPPQDGLDTPLHPLNQGPEVANGQQQKNQIVPQQPVSQGP